MENTSVEIKENVLQEDHILADYKLLVEKNAGERNLKNSHFWEIDILIIGL